MNRGLYPKNWEQMAFEIKQAAKWTCEGCGRPCIRPDESIAKFVERITTEMPIWLVDNPAAHPRRFLLSVAHLDHLPQNCDRANLRAWCCPCHGRYDLGQMPLKKHLKAEREGQLSLSAISPADAASSVRRWLVGDQLALLPNVAPYRIDPNSEKCSGRDNSPQPQPHPSNPIEAEPMTKSDGHRRHRHKGQASGWIEERTGNQKRKQPTISYYYRWDSPAGRVNEYIRASKLARVNQLVEADRPALEILRVVTEGKKLSGVSAKLLNTPVS